MKKGGRAVSLVRRKLAVDVLDGIRSQPARVGLAFFAIMIGIIALTVLLAVLGGLKQRSRVLIRELGANVIAVLAPDSGPGRKGRWLDEYHARTLERSLPGSRASFVRRIDVKDDASGKDLRVMLTDDALAAVRGWRIVRGRFFDRRDVETGERYAVVSRGPNDAPGRGVGDILQIHGMPFRIVGMVEAGSGALEGEVNDDRLMIGPDVVLVPQRAGVGWDNEPIQTAHHVDTLFLQIPADVNMETAADIAQRVMAAPDMEVAGLSWVTPSSVLRGIRRLQNAVRLAGGSIALLCLILGGTTLMSLMVANVRDRVGEIGLRRSLGATSADIALLFTTEACLVTAASALAGTVTAFILLWVVRSRFGASLDIGLLTVLIPVAVSLLLGAAFSYWPAKLASRISPSEALRNE